MRPPDDCSFNHCTVFPLPTPFTPLLLTNYAETLLDLSFMPRCLGYVNFREYCMHLLVYEHYIYGHYYILLSWPSSPSSVDMPCAPWLVALLIPGPICHLTQSLFPVATVNDGCHPPIFKCPFGRFNLPTVHCDYPVIFAYLSQLTSTDLLPTDLFSPVFVFYLKSAYSQLRL